MLNIKKICILVSILFLFLIRAEADTAPERYSIFLKPLFGLGIGHSDEIVYKYSWEKTYLSELIWDLKPVYYAGLALDFRRENPFARNGITATGSVKFGLPLKTGIMEDRDWQYINNNELTNYSRHDVYLQAAIHTGLSAGYSWRLTDYLALGAYGEFSYMRYSWMAEDGYVQYLYSDEFGYIIPGQTWDKETTPKYNIYGPGIRYTQNWFLLSPGLTIKGKINPLFSLEGHFSYSPLIYCMDRDDHLFKQLSFWGFLSYGHHINCGGSFICSPFDKFDFSLSASYRYITGTRGSTYVKSTGIQGTNTAYQTSSDGGGAGYKVLDIGLAVRIKIYN